MKRFKTILLFSFFVLPVALQAQTTQTVRGQVIDKETQIPLIGATLQILGSNAGTATDVNGNFRFPNIPTGRITLQISYLGYEPRQIAELEVNSGKELVLQIELKEDTKVLNEVVIVARTRKDLPQNSMASVSARTFSVEEARRYAGTADDPARMASNFAGVTTGSAESNAIIIRGNSPTGVLWRMEGVDIPVPSHFNGGTEIPGGGTFTMFSSSMLANSDFYTGAFPAEYGNAVAGVFDMKFRNGNNEKHEFSAQLGIQGAEFAAEGPFNKKYGGSYLFHIRVSTLGLVKSFIPEMSGNQSINYEDLSFKINLPTRRSGTFSIWGIGGTSRSKRDAEDDPELWTENVKSTDVNMRYNVTAAGLSHKQSLNQSLYLSSTLAATWMDTKMEIDKRIDKENPTRPYPVIDKSNQTYKLSLSSFLNHRHSAGWHSRYGLRLEQLFDRVNYRLANDDYLLQRISHKNSNTQLLQAYAQSKYALISRLTLTGGIHASWFTLNNDFSIEPRLALDWTLNDKHTLSLGSGLHSQTDPLYLYFMEVKNPNGTVTTPNKQVKMTRSWHNVLAYNWTVSPLLRFKVEPYFQYLFNVPVVENSTFSAINFTTLPPLFDNRFVNTGRGRNIGIDFTLERFLQAGYYYMATLSLFDSRYRDAKGDWHNTLFNTHYVINLLGGKEFTFRRKNGLNRVLSINAHIMLTAARPSSPIDMPATLHKQEIVYDESDPFSQRRKGVEPTTDFSVGYRVNYRRCSGTLSLQIKNLIGRQYLGQNFNQTTQLPEDFYFKSMIPFISYRIDF